MPFKPKAQRFGSAIGTVTLGSGDNAVTLGGSRVLPFHFFDGDTGNAPKIGVQISDAGVEDIPGVAAFYAGAEGIAERAKRAAEMPGADFVTLSLDSADPNGKNATVEACVENAKAAASAIDKPLCIMGCKNAEKDAVLFEKIAAALEGKNVLFLSAKEENYKTVGAAAGLAYGQKVGAESAVDINLAKQLNFLLTQLGLKTDGIVMNLGSAAAGYGFEYVISTIDRVRLAALGQGDAMLAVPIVTPVAEEAWGVKESMADEADMPGWGPAENRGVNMEIATAAACLASGSDAVILRHPASVAAISAFVAALV